jgi:hypothetical protein
VGWPIRTVKASTSPVHYPNSSHPRTFQTLATPALPKPGIRFIKKTAAAPFCISSRSRPPPSTTLGSSRSRPPRLTYSCLRPPPAVLIFLTPAPAPLLGAPAPALPFVAPTPRPRPPPATTCSCLRRRSSRHRMHRSSRDADTGPEERVTPTLDERSARR